MSRFIALIPAAGSGSRMGADCPKQYLHIHEKPLLWYSLNAFVSHPAIDQVVVVVAPHDEWFAAYDWSAFGKKLRVLPVGGASRGESVLNGLHALNSDVRAEDWILVHDAARPGLDHHLIDQLLTDLSDDVVGGLLALPVADTVKLADEQNRVVETRSRDGLWQAQTPQMFKYGLLTQALEQANPALVTDEASAIELLGLAPKLVRGALKNWKVTYPEDLQWAALWLSAK